MKELLNFEEMLVELENKKQARRIDWGYDKSSNIQLLESNCFEKNFFITNTLKCAGADLIGYGFTYSDIKSSNWVITELI